jgi:hypothetical protein
MKYINKLNANSFQTAFLTGNPGQRIRMDLRYLPTQEVWLADFELEDFIVNGIAVTKSPNILRNYKNIIPFGISCTTADGGDPRSLGDFEDQYAALYLLTQDEVLEIEEGLFE